jgi:hypothetical protein
MGREARSVVLVISHSDFMPFSAIFQWGRWESNPHELPRPLLRRLRLPFRHFPLGASADSR